MVNFQTVFAGTVGILGGALVGFYVQVFLNVQFDSRYERRSYPWFTFVQSKMLESYRAERDIRLKARLLRLESMEEASNAEKYSKE